MVARDGVTLHELERVTEVRFGVDVRNRRSQEKWLGNAHGQALFSIEIESMKARPRRARRVPNAIHKAKRAASRAARSSFGFKNRSANRTQARSAHTVHEHDLHSEAAEIHG